MRQTGARCDDGSSSIHRSWTLKPHTWVDVLVALNVCYSWKKSGGRKEVVVRMVVRKSSCEGGIKLHSWKPAIMHACMKRSFDQADCRIQHVPFILPIRIAYLFNNLPRRPSRHSRRYKMAHVLTHYFSSPQHSTRHPS